MRYKSVTHDLRNYLGGLTSSPDSIITTPIPSKHIVLGNLQQFYAGNNFEGAQIILKEIIGDANPKWVRDEWSVSVQVIGENRSKYDTCEALIGETIFSMLGSGSIYIGDRVYVHMKSNQLPRFVGHLDNSKPVFSATLDFVVEGVKDEYNRKAMS